MAQKKSAVNIKDKSVLRQAAFTGILNNQPDAVPWSCLKLAGIIHESVVDGPGIRSVVFVQGCPHKCDCCHSEETWDFNGGSTRAVESVADEIISRPHIDGVTYSGGEPFCQPKALLSLTKLLIKKNSRLNFWIYSGYTYEYLLKLSAKNREVKGLLELCEILVDGPFIDSQKDLKLKFRGSANQRIIDLKNKKVLE
jgi:anaerobic ribonucleoside-triphosphate reductase activating protein